MKKTALIILCLLLSSCSARYVKPVTPKFEYNGTLNASAPMAIRHAKSVINEMGYKILGYSHLPDNVIMLFPKETVATPDDCDCGKLDGENIIKPGGTKSDVKLIIVITDHEIVANAIFEPHSLKQEKDFVYNCVSKGRIEKAFIENFTDILDLTIGEEKHDGN